MNILIEVVLGFISGIILKTIFYAVCEKFEEDFWESLTVTLFIVGIIAITILSLMYNSVFEVVGEVILGIMIFVVAVELGGHLYEKFKK